jgi:molybdenum cofactor guanylyltransferase
VPCDVPFLPTDLVARLLTEASASGLARAADAEGVQYAVMLMRHNLLDDLEAYLRGGGRKVQDWQSRHACVDVPFTAVPHAFLNINTPADLARAAQYTSHEEVRQ